MSMGFYLFVSRLYSRISFQIREIDVLFMTNVRKKLGLTSSKFVNLCIKHVDSIVRNFAHA